MKMQMLVLGLSMILITFILWVLIVGAWEWIVEELAETWYRDMHALHGRELDYRYPKPWYVLSYERREARDRGTCR